MQTKIIIRQKREHANAKHAKHASWEARTLSTQVQKHAKHASTQARQARKHAKHASTQARQARDLADSSHVIPSQC